MKRTNTAQIALLTLTASCTGQLPGSFRYQQQEEAFSSQQQVNTKIDLLWVVDNSSSMDVSQKALRDKFAGFAKKYLKPYWDIRVAVITTDTYLANPVFQNYMNTTIPGSVNFKSYYLASMVAARAAAVNPATDGKLSTLSLMGVSVTTSVGSAGIFTNGIKYKDLVPGWARGTDYARLLPGIHDGPIAALCTEKLPYFAADDNAAYPLVFGPQCKIRDASDTYTGVAQCLNPTSGTSVTQCVNTVLNDTVHSGKAILLTKPDGIVPDQDAWVQSLIDNFTVNVSVGSAGGGSERGLGSVMEFIDNNESSATAFFRPDSLRGIIFVSDEDDQTMTLPNISAVPTGFSPDTDYGCDMNSLVTANTGKFADPTNFLQNQYKYCCTSGCALKPTTCPVRTVGSLTYSVGVCPDASKLVTVASVKDKLDAFFLQLDGNKYTTPNYFVFAIVATSDTTIQTLQAARYQSDDHLDTMPFYNSSGAVVTQARPRIPAVDKGWRYIEFADAVGNGSMSYDIGSPDYSVLLDSIGTTIIQKKSVFQLTFAPTTKDEMIVKVNHADGTSTIVDHAQYEFSGKTLTITDLPFVLSLKDTDAVVINYQPASLN
ncbi:MAG: hypothetical protein JST16_14710 [Bdellovibrionales bacterium]|nr:hypothetical protein [Bdellovibrionales bacterium]